MAQKQQDVVENINRIVRKDTDEDRSLGPAEPRKPIGPTRGMAWVNSNGGVSSASAGGASSGGSGSGGSGGPSTSGGGGSSGGLPKDADNSMNYGGGGGGGGYRDPLDPTDPDSGYEPLPPDGQEAGTNDMTGDEAMTASPDKGDPTGFGTSMDGSKAGWYCKPEGGSVQIRLGLEGQHLPPDGWEPDGDGGYKPEPTDTFYYWSTQYWDNWIGDRYTKTIEEKYPLITNFVETELTIGTVKDISVVEYSGNEYGVFAATKVDPPPPSGYGNRGIYQVTCTSNPAQCTDGVFNDLNTTYPEDGVCGLQLIDGLWVPDPQDPDCEGLGPQKCYLVSNSCPGSDGVMFCVLDDLSVMATNWVGGSPEIDGITRIYTRQPDDSYKQTGWVSNSQRDDYF